MVKRSPEPGVHSMALLTILWCKLGAGCEVVRYAQAHRCGALEIFRMT